MLTPQELARYNKHIVLQEFGTEKQLALKRAKVLIVGAGGLGVPAMIYLVAAGIGELGIADFDVVEESNLQRQPLYSVMDIGKSKAIVAKEKLALQNPHVAIHTHLEKITSHNALEILSYYDVIIDGTDNFQTKYLLNDAAYFLKKPLVYGSIIRFQGQVSVFNYDGSPNYRDLFPTPPMAGEMLSCAEAGVIGVLPGIIGSLQALEAIKIVTNTGLPLAARLLQFDGISCTFTSIAYSYDDANPLSGNNPTITSLTEMTIVCDTISQNKNKDNNTIKSITPNEMEEWRKEKRLIKIIDVRESFEFDIVNMGGELIPLSKIVEKFPNIWNEEYIYIFHCKSGSRSSKAIEALQKSYDYPNLYNLSGGILQWIKEVAPSFPTY